MRRRATAERRLTVIISDLMHDCESTDEVYASMASLLRIAGVERVVGIGPEMKSHAADFGTGSSFY